MKDFSKGLNTALNKVPHGDLKKTREDIMKILEIKSKAAFWYYQTGKKIPSADKAEKIIEYFNDRGIYNVYE